jgi:hypothetical protein
MGFQPTECRCRGQIPDTDHQEAAMDVGIIERNPQAAPAKAAFAKPQLASLEVDGDLKAAAERLEETRQHHLDLYAKRDVTTQTTTPAGDRVDWVPLESQTDGAPAEPPSLDEACDIPERPTLAAARTLLAPDVEQGPPGTVPVLRKNVDTMRPVGNLQDYLAKGLHPRLILRRTTRTRPPPAPPTSTLTRGSS